MPLRRRLSIDLGTSTSLIYDLNQGMLLQEPSVIAYDAYTEKVIAWGHEAELLRGRSTPNIKIERPLNNGVIVSPDAAYLMLEQFLKTALKRSWLFAPLVTACVPTGATQVERRALREALELARTQLLYLIDEPIAAAIGAGLSVTEPVGHTVIDIGAGTSEIAVIGMTGILCSESIDVAGDELTAVIQRYLKKEHKLVVSFQSAEHLKHNLGAVHPIAGLDDKEMTISGTNLITSLPGSVVIQGESLRPILFNQVEPILLAIQQTLEQLPPELAGDVAQLGITLVGGGSLLNGLQHLIAEKFQIPVNVPTDPINCGVLGAGEAMAHPEKYSCFLRNR